MRRLAAALLLISLAFPGIAAASTTTYTVRATFQAALSGFTTYDFESSGGSVTSFAAGEVTVGGTRGGNDGTNFVSDVWQATVPTAQLQPAAIVSYAGSRALAADVPAAPWRPLVLTFADAQHAVGFDDLDLTASGGSPTEVAVVLVYFDGLPASQFTVSVTTNLAAAFFGIISTDPIRSVEIYGAEAGNLTYRGGRSNLVDNVTLGTP